MDGLQENEIVQPKYDGKNIYYATPIDAIFGKNGESLSEYINNIIQDKVDNISVTESGSNTNGTWVKFSDGTLLCHGRKSGTQSQDLQDYWGQYKRTVESSNSEIHVTFPMEFIDVPVVIPAVDNGSVTVSTQVYSKSTTKAIFVLLKPNSVTRKDYLVEYIALGRWKDYDVAITSDNSAIAKPTKVYSDTERVIGLWRDKRPLYQKTIYVTQMPNAVALSIDPTIPNLDRVTNFYGLASPKTKGSASTFSITSPRIDNPSTTTFSCWVDETNKIVLTTGSDRTTHYAEVTLEYVKTTDQPSTSRTADLLTVVNGKYIDNLDVIIQQRITDLIDDKFKTYVNNAITQALADNNKVVWTNPKPSQAFTQQDITLTSGNYKYLTFYYYNWIGGATSNGGTRIESVTIPKGYNVNMTASIKLNGGSQHLATRGGNYVNDTKYTILGQQGVTIGGSLTTNNQWIIPLMIVAHQY